MYDLIVIGAGPAGSAAAITAARSGARVLLLEKGYYPRHKVCGEFVSAESHTLLSSLLGRASLLDAAPRIGTARLWKNLTHADVPVDPPGISLTRYDLDAALWTAAKHSGVVALDHTTALSISRTRNGFSIETGEKTFAASSVVLAAGRWSNLDANKHSPNSPKLIGIKSHFFAPDVVLDDALNRVELHFLRGGYCGVQPIANGVVSACTMIRADVARSLPELFEMLPALRSRARNWDPVFNPVVTSPLLFCPPVPERDDILHCGDAAGFVDPFVGDGISLALNSGTLAASCLAPLWRGECTLSDAVSNYREHYLRRFGRVFRNAAHIRRLLSLSDSLQTAAAHVLRFPAVSRQFIRLTRVA